MNLYTFIHFIIYIKFKLQNEKKLKDLIYKLKIKSKSNPKKSK